jgi:hypothetical protein
LKRLVDEIAKWRSAAARSTGGTAENIRLTPSTERCFVAMEPRQTPIVARLIHKGSVALLTRSQIRKRRVPTERLEKHRGWEKREARILQVDDGGLIGRPLEVREFSNEKRQFERRMFGDFHIQDLERIKPRRLEGYLIGGAPRSKTNLSGSDDDRMGRHLLIVNHEAHGIIRVQSEMNRFVYKLRCDIQETTETCPKPSCRAIGDKIAAADFTFRKHCVHEITITQLLSRSIVV